MFVTYFKYICETMITTSLGTTHFAETSNYRDRAFHNTFSAIKIEC